MTMKLASINSVHSLGDTEVIELEFHQKEEGSSVVKKLFKYFYVNPKNVYWQEIEVPKES